MGHGISDKSKDALKDVKNGAGNLGNDIENGANNFGNEFENGANNFGRETNQWFNGNHHPFAQYTQPIANWFNSFLN